MVKAKNEYNDLKDYMQKKDEEEKKEKTLNKYKKQKTIFYLAFLILWGIRIFLSDSTKEIIKEAVMLTTITFLLLLFFKDYDYQRVKNFWGENK